MANSGPGFAGHYDFIEPRRVYRRWLDETKARIVAESFQPGARVVEVARLYDLSAHQLSSWRQQARQRRLSLPAALMDNLPTLEREGSEAAFVPLTIDREAATSGIVTPTLPVASTTAGVLTVEIDTGVKVHVPADIPVERIAALIRAMRGTS